MISYYELLKRIEKGDIPEKIKVHLTSKPRVYEAEYDESDFSHYFIYDGDTDEDYHYYLAECFLESNMFDKNIEILEEEKKIPEKIDVWYEPIKDTKLERHDIDTSIEILANMCDDLKDKYNEIIDYLKSKGDE